MRNTTTLAVYMRCHCILYLLYCIDLIETVTKNEYAYVIKDSLTPYENNVWTLEGNGRRLVCGLTHTNLKQHHLPSYQFGEPD